MGGLTAAIAETKRLAGLTEVKANCCCHYIFANLLEFHRCIVAWFPANSLNLISLLDSVTRILYMTMFLSI